MHSVDWACMLYIYIGACMVANTDLTVQRTLQHCDWQAASAPLVSMVAPPPSPTAAATARAPAPAPAWPTPAWCTTSSKQPKQWFFWWQHNCRYCSYSFYNSYSSLFCDIIGNFCFRSLLVAAWAEWGVAAQVQLMHPFVFTLFSSKYLCFFWSQLWCHWLNLSRLHAGSIRDV